MANVLGALLLVIVRAFIADWVYSLFRKAGTWLDTKINGRTAKVVIGMLLGLAAYILIPVFAGLLGF